MSFVQSFLVMLGHSSTHAKEIILTSACVWDLCVWGICVCGVMCVCSFIYMGEIRFMCLVCCVGVYIQGNVLACAHVCVCVCVWVGGCVVCVCVGVRERVSSYKLLVAGYL